VAEQDQDQFELEQAHRDMSREATQLALYAFADYLVSVETRKHLLRLSELMLDECGISQEANERIIQLASEDVLIDRARYSMLYAIATQDIPD
jgi:hypothetical protein